MVHWLEIEVIDSQSIKENWISFSKIFSTQFSNELLWVLKRYFSITKEIDWFYINLNTTVKHWKSWWIIVGWKTYRWKEARRVIMNQALWNHSPRSWVQIWPEILWYTHSIKIDWPGVENRMISNLLNSSTDVDLSMKYIERMDQWWYGDKLVW